MRFWMVLSSCAAVGVLAHGLLTREPPPLEAYRPVYSPQVAEEMVKPQCAQFRTLTTGAQVPAVPQSVFADCVGFLLYRTDGRHGLDQLPNTPAEYAVHVEQLSRKHERHAVDYRMAVFGLPALVFVALWLFFFSARRVVRWVRSGSPPVSI